MDWSLPLTTSDYITGVLPSLAGKDEDSATMFFSTPSNQPDHSIRWNRSTSKFQEWSTGGAAWTDLTVAAGLGYGTMALQNSNAVNISGGTIAGVTITTSTITSSTTITSTTATNTIGLDLIQTGAGDGPTLRMRRTAGTTTDWQFYIPSGTPDLVLYNGGVGVRFYWSRTGPFTAYTTASNNPGLVVSTSTSGGGLTFQNTNANSAARDWSIAANYLAYGDFAILRGLAKGNEPLADGSGAIRLYYNGDEFGIPAGRLNATGFGVHSFTAGGTGANRINVSNTTAGAANYARIGLSNDASVQVVLDVYSSTYTSSGVNQANGGMLDVTGAGGLSIITEHASGEIRFYTGGTTERMRIHASGGVSVGTAVNNGAGSISLSSTTPLYAGLMGSAAGTTAVMDTNGFLKKTTSSLRYKEHVRSWSISENILDRFVALTPKLWDYKGQDSGAYGFIAEDLEGLNIIGPHGRSILLNYDAEGRPDSNRDFTLISLQHLVLQSQAREIRELKARLERANL